MLVQAVSATAAEERVSHMTSVEIRDNPLFMRNGFETVGKWDIPLVKKQDIDLKDIQPVVCSDTRAHDSEENKRRDVLPTRLGECTR